MKNVKISPDSKFLVSYDKRNIKIYYIPTGNFILKYQSYCDIFKVKITPDSKLLIFLTVDSEEKKIFSLEKSCFLKGF